MAEVFFGDVVDYYDALKALADAAGQSVTAYVADKSIDEIMASIGYVQIVDDFGNFIGYAKSFFMEGVGAGAGAGAGVIASKVVAEDYAVAIACHQAGAGATGGSIAAGGLITSVATSAIAGGVTAALGLKLGEHINETNPAFWDGLLEAIADGPGGLTFNDALHDGVNYALMTKDGHIYVPDYVLERAKTYLIESGAYGKTVEPEIKKGEFVHYALSPRFTTPSEIAEVGLARLIQHYPDDPPVITENDYACMRVTGTVDVPEIYLYIFKNVGDIDFQLYKEEDPIVGDETRFVSGAFSNPNVVRSYYFHYSGTSFAHGINQDASLGIPYYPPRGEILIDNLGSFEYQEGVEVQDDAEIPLEDITLEDLYDMWADGGLTIPGLDFFVDEDGNPQNYSTWFPLSLPTNNPATDGVTTPQGDAQQGQEYGPQSAPLTQDMIDYLIGIISPVIPPNPPSGDEGSSPVVTPPLTGNTTSMFRIYNPSVQILRDFGAWMWTTDSIELIKQMFSNNPIDGIIGLHVIYGTPSIGGTSPIHVGFLNSGINSPWVNQQYIPIDCGTIHVPEYFRTAYDYEPYTKVYAYLPFIGIMELSSYDVVGADVGIKYTIDVLTGVVLCNISVTKNNTGGILYTFNGSCAVNMPLTSGSYSSNLASALGNAVSGAVTGLMMGGWAGAGAGAVSGAIKGAFRSPGADIRISGSLSGNAGAMAPRKPYLIIKRSVPYNALEYNALYGYPANKTVFLKECLGFTRVKEVHVEALDRATDEEKNMIEAALKEGVVIR